MLDIGCFLLVVLAAPLASLVSFCAYSALRRQNQFQVFLSHANGPGGAVARLFKLMLMQRFPRTKAFIDSDKLTISMS